MRKTSESCSPRSILKWIRWPCASPICTGCVTELPEFKDDPKKSNEGKLEAIQMAWHAEFLDRTQGTEPSGSRISAIQKLYLNDFSTPRHSIYIFMTTPPDACPKLQPNLNGSMSGRTLR